MTAAIPVLPVCVHAVHRDSCAGPLYIYRYRGQTCGVNLWILWIPYRRIQ